MGLNETDRKAIVKYRLESASTTFAEVPSHMENKFYRTAANRLYYACYYAASALLINDSYEAHTHSGVKTLLGLHYFSQNKLDMSFSKMYRQLFNLRQTGDYEDLIKIDEEEVKPFVEFTEQFISAIENLISSQP